MAHTDYPEMTIAEVVAAVGADAASVIEDCSGNAYEEFFGDPLTPAYIAGRLRSLAERIQRAANAVEDGRQ